MYGVILTSNYKPIEMKRYDTEREAEYYYQKYKEEGCNVIKVKIFKSNELGIIKV
ncbi:hypothetical protein KO561_12950 [Radiobacillus kanasensis]|uniref:hypothetical protein n=1 Tax=Radiobacillus kanasensis TaxID=2844358 RepID=UPI001E5E660C|nr:hypothetical protein [Radiobacillus kanasensis]UFT98110.1 hypothetical protein KO561_12950 [Radiobacillus kanasensis]